MRRSPIPQGGSFGNTAGVQYADPRLRPFTTNDESAANTGAEGPTERLMNEQRRRGGGQMQSAPQLPNQFQRAQSLGQATSPSQIGQPVQVQQQPMQPAPGMFRADGTANYSQIALRDNMARNIQMNTMAAANPATANLPHVKAAIAARNQRNEGLAAQSGYGPNYFANRQFAQDANTRQDAITGATTDQMAADTNRVNTMLPGQVENQRQVNTGLNLANQGQALQNRYAPGMYQGQQAQQAAVTGKTTAETGQIQAETGQIAQGADSFKAAAAQYKKENEDLKKQLDALRTQLATGGIDPNATPKDTNPDNLSVNGKKVNNVQQGWANAAGVTQNKVDVMTGPKAAPGQAKANPDGTILFNGKKWKIGPDRVPYEVR